MYRQINIENRTHLLKLEEMAEKLNHLCLSLKIRLDEKRMFESSEQVDLLDNVIEFFIDYSDELIAKINTSEVGDIIYLNKSSEKMLRNIISFYEKEIRESENSIVQKEKEDFERFIAETVN